MIGAPVLFVVLLLEGASNNWWTRLGDWWDPPAPAGQVFSGVHGLNILHVESHPIEWNDVYKEWWWGITVQNTSATTQSFDATVQFVAQDGFIVDTDREFHIVLAAGAEHQITGTHMIAMPGAEAVMRTAVELTGR